MHAPQQPTHCPFVRSRVVVVSNSGGRGQRRPDVSPRHEATHGFVSLHRVQRRAADGQQADHVDRPLYVPLGASPKTKFGTGVVCTAGCMVGRG